jgi:hypothetical protein
VQRTTKIWRRPPQGAAGIDHSLARLATMAIALLIAHSFVDYPLRTSAMTAVFAFCCALLIEPVSGAASDCNSEGKSSTDSMMRTNVHTKARIAPTLAGRTGGVISMPSAPAGERWGEGIDWPDEWRNRMRT